MWYFWFGKKILPLIKYGGVIFLGLVVVLSFAQNLPIPGNFQSLVVMSGSMEPKIHVGSVAIVKPSEDIKTGDIITFSDPRDPTSLVTHRIESIENEIFKTKGDANNTPDNWEVTKDNIVGKFLFSVPYLGYAVNFAKQPPGFLLLILFPALLIIINEIGSIKKEFGKKYEKKGENKTTVAAMAIGVAFLTFAFSSGKTLALFSDTETSSGNTITVGVWADANSCVVLNEILPNPEGDDDQSGLDGEWVELYNNCDSEFDVSDWYIEDASAGGNRQTISSSTTNGGQTVLGAPGSGSEWLVLFMGGAVLNNGGDTVTLYNSDGEEVDSYQFTASSNDGDSDSDNTPGSSNTSGAEDPGNEGKSFARIPDGTGDWVDPVPTPNSPNKLEDIVTTHGSPDDTNPEPEPEPEPEPASEPETEDVAAAVSAALEDPPESSPSAKPVPDPEPVPESSESAQPKEDDE